MGLSNDRHHEGYYSLYHLSNLKVTGKVTIADENREVWQLEHTTPLALPDTEYVYVGEDSLAFYETPKDTVPFTQMPRKLEVGTSWTWTFKPKDQMPSFTVNSKVEAEEDVTVKAGKYKKCLKVKETAEFEHTIGGQKVKFSYEGYRWMAKDLGEVKVERTFTGKRPTDTAITKFKIELIKTNIKLRFGS